MGMLSLCCWFLDVMILLILRQFFFSETNILQADGIGYTCTIFNNAAMAGELGPAFCLYLTRFDERCECPQFPDDTKSTCSLCLAVGIQNP
jgi:hypothetical protein